MKLLLIIMITITSSCAKKENISDDVFITIYNECRAEIKVYNISDGRQCLNDMYDCEHVSFLPIRLEPGTYNLRAETFQGRIAEKQFTKTRASHNVEITF
jgi:hypothetical protein